MVAAPAPAYSYVENNICTTTNAGAGISHNTARLQSPEARYIPINATTIGVCWSRCGGDVHRIQHTFDASSSIQTGCTLPSLGRELSPSLRCIRAPLSKQPAAPQAPSVFTRGEDILEPQLQTATTPVIAIDKRVENVSCGLRYENMLMKACLQCVVHRSNKAARIKEQYLLIRAAAATSFWR